MNTLFLPELREMIAAEDEQGLREFTDALHPARAAEFMEGLSAEEAWRVLRVADADRRVDVFAFLDEQKQTELVETLARAGEHGPISQLVSDLAADDRVDLLSGVDEAVVEELLPLLPHADRRETLRLLGYPEGTAGSKMTTEVARLREGLTVSQALAEISRQAQDLETVYYNYVVDESDRLLGLVSARQLVTHYLRPDTPVGELMQRDVVTVNAMDDQEAVAAKVADFDFLAIPVVDDERRLLGIITHDDVIDVLRAEATEDALLAGGVAPLAEGYLRTPWLQLALNRGIWISVLFVTALFTAGALRNYEGSFKAAPWLILFLPLITSCGGNSGTQSATLVIRGLGDGELRLRDWPLVLRRELVTGLCLGLGVAILGTASAWTLSRGLDDAPTFREVLVVPATLLLIVVFATVVGGSLPLLFRRLGLDPALMSNPFVTGVIDIAGIVLYMTVAMAMLRGLGG